MGEQKTLDLIPGEVAIIHSITPAIQLAQEILTVPIMQEHPFHIRHSVQAMAHGQMEPIQLHFSQATEGK